MKNLSLCLTVVFCWIAMQACKKGSEVVLPPETNKPETVVYKDSISFTVNQTKYLFTDRLGFGLGNYPVNVKKSEVKISGGKLAGETGGYYFYGTPDSTLYSAQYEFLTKDVKQRLKIIFTKKFKDSELVWKAPVLYLQNHDVIFKTGKLGFAADLDKENTMEGVAIKLSDRDMKGPLISMIPGFSILVRTDLKKDIQDNSNFNITKVEKNKYGQYVIEAKFDLNLFDEEGKLYRLENGFLRFIAPTLYN